MKREEYIEEFLQKRKDISFISLKRVQPLTSRINICYK